MANGGLAQMGERLLCTQEVIGSIPLASIEDWKFSILLRVSTLKTEYNLAKNRDNRKTDCKSDRERENSEKKT